MNFVDELERHLEDGVRNDTRRRIRRRRVARVATAATLAIACVAGVSALVVRSPTTNVTTDLTTSTLATERPTTTVTNDTPSETLPVPGPAPEPAEDPAAEAFGLVGSVQVWTGSELFVWGGTTAFGGGSTTTTDGILYDPITATSRPLPPAPGGPQSEAAGAWTGSEVVICCGSNAGLDAASALAYTPATDTWRELPPPPLAEWVVGPAAAIVDGLVVIVSRSEMVAFDPSNDTWRTLAPPPVELSVSPGSSVVAVGDQLVVWPGASTRTRATGLLYDLATDTWTELPDPPIEHWPGMPDVAWTGTELIILGGLPAPMADDSERLVGARLDWATRQWTPLPDVWPEPIPNEGNLGSQTILWTGDILLVAAGNLGTGVDPLDSALATYNPATDQWRQLPSIIDGAAWHPTLTQINPDTALVHVGGTLTLVRASASDGQPVAGTGFPAAATPPYTDLPVRDVAITLVGTNGNGADIVVLDLELGLQTIYQNDVHHQLGSGGLTDLAVVDRDLYLWRTDDPTIRFDGGDRPYGGDRLSFGELSQPATVVEPGGIERSLIPIPGTDALWVWHIQDDRAIATLFETGGTPITEAQVRAGFAPRGVTDNRTLIASDDQGIIAVSPDGTIAELGAGEVLAVTTDTVLAQTCTDTECTRSWIDLATGTRDDVDANELAWHTTGGPAIPGHSLPLEALSGDRTQLLITVAPIGSQSVGLARADLATMTTQTIGLPDGMVWTVATWTRDSEQIVVVAGNDVAIANLRTGRVVVQPDLVPDGFFILGAG